MKITSFRAQLGTPVGAALLLISTHAISGPGAHVHGTAELTLAIEGTALEIIFSSPAINVIGFEHRASTPAQLKAIASAKAALSDGAKWFTFEGSRCEPRETDVDVTAVQQAAAAAHTGHQHNNHSHNHSSKAPHSDLSAHYTFECEAKRSLKSVQLGSGGLPFGLERIHVMWVTERGQGAAELTPRQTVFELK